MGSMLKNGGGLLMDCLIALGGTKGFGVPGESYLAVLMRCMIVRVNLTLCYAAMKAALPIWPKHGES